MKLFIIPFIGLTAGMLVSCSSEEIRTEPTPSPSPKTVTLQFKLGEEAFSRADDEGNNVESLQLAFYKSNNGSPLFLQTEQATKEETPDIYSVELEIIPNNEPDLVIAYVNISDEQIIKNAVSTSPSTVEEILTENGNLIMSSPRFFDAQNNDIYYQKFDYTSTTPINLEVERVAAKVTVTKSAESNAFPDVNAIDANGKSTTLHLNLSGWGVNATDNKSYLMHQIGKFHETDAMFSFWSGWNNSESNSLNWATSINYNHDFENDHSPASLSLITLSEASKNFGSATYCHETTRKLESSEFLNAKPSVIISGSYTINGNSAPMTFYRINKSIFSEDELWEYFTKKLSNKILVSNEKPTIEILKKKCSITNVEEINGKSIPYSYVSLQLNDESSFTDFSGLEAATVSKDALNAALAEWCGIAEMYENGKCYFSIPINHEQVGEKIVYGLVRNHYYQIALNGISGFGNGVKGDDPVLSEQPLLVEDDNKCKVSFKLTIREWTTHSQNVVITK